MSASPGRFSDQSSLSQRAMLLPNGVVLRPDFAFFSGEADRKSLMVFRFERTFRRLFNNKLV